jgi:hypothetical protein
MKRYNLTPNGAQVDDNGVWVRAEDAKRLRDAINDQIELSEYWIQQYQNTVEATHGPMSDNDLRIWRETGYRSNAMSQSWEVLRNSASLASCSPPKTYNQD